MIFQVYGFQKNFIVNFVPQKLKQQRYMKKFFLMAAFILLPFAMNAQSVSDESAQIDSVFANLDNIPSDAKIRQFGKEIDKATNAYCEALNAASATFSNSVHESVIALGLDMDVLEERVGKDVAKVIKKKLKKEYKKPMKQSEKSESKLDKDLKSTWQDVLDTFK